MTQYPISNSTVCFGDKAINWMQNFLRSEEYTQLVVLVDENTKTHCLEDFFSLFCLPTDTNVICITPGEKNKSTDSLAKILSELVAFGIDRNSVFINLGGGLINDIGGLAASLYLRGIDYVNIPTTLLAQVDASIGSKVGVNIGNFKNQAGLFSPALSILIHSSFLSSLPEREILSGKAEIIKHGILAGGQHWERLADKEFMGNSIQTTWWENTIQESVKFKTRIVSLDPNENDIRKTLNFGHTIGHAIETFSLNRDKSPISHGEAIAIGMVCEIYLSNLLLGLGEREMAEITTLIKNTFPSYVISDDLIKSIPHLLFKDKKRKGDNINFTLLEKVGNPKINQNPQEPAIIDAINYYKTNHPSK